ncbi:MAG: hypothetical protein JO093_13710 [Acidobacteria bacterium]|nr:hypothetical protein [Acidobacteriota bacterium]MBV9068522.1 hypothetical protein [Acidobacteriota bacterium]MBV9186670.1 hypothetical protein [Acidobacteriota bacterium]
MTSRLTTAFLFLFILASSCTDTPATLGTWSGAADKPLPPPLTVDVLCDPSAGSTCTEATLREVLRTALAQAAERPDSVVRLWVQGSNIETTRMVGEARSIKPHAPGRRARQQHESRWIAEQLRSLMTAAQPSLRKHPRRSPIAETIGRVALATPPTKDSRLLIVVTDAFEVSGFGSFECGLLPTPDRFANVLSRERVLPAGSLRGVSIIFSHVDLVSVDRGRCPLSLRRAADVRAIWETALRAAGATHVEIQSGSFQAPPEKEAPHV